MSGEALAGQSRRGVLGRALLLLGGAIGVGAGAAGATAATRPPAAVRLELRGRGLVLRTPERQPGERIRPGDQSAVVGELLDARSGKPLGRFYGSRLAFASGLDGHAAADASSEVHTFRLAGGTIQGVGSVVEGESVFAIVGGTGRYAGARGSYVAVQRLRELGGDGSAHFVLDLIA